MIIAGWADQPIVLYHGTLDVHVASILGAVDVTRGAPLKDFARGFSTTTNLDQARRWARDKATGTPHNPAVVSLTVPRNDLARLDCLFFARGDKNAIDYWGFVHHCRTTAGDHRRLHAAWYDVVAGPVSGSWKKMTVIPDADQISFHTPAAEQVLNGCPRAQVP
jgi:Protein of unknown function (DUF3990)